MARSMWLSVAVVLAVASASSALKCLRCDDCKNKPTLSFTCPSGSDACIKTSVGGVVRKSCGPSNVCSLETEDKTSSLNPLQKLKRIFNDIDIKNIDIRKLIHDKRHARDKLVHCCKTDFCNGASSKIVSASLFFVLPLALYLLGC